MNYTVSLYKCATWKLEFLKTKKVVRCDDSLCFCAANPAERAEVMGHAGSAAVGLQPAHEHGGSLRAPAGGVGGGEDGPLPPHLGAGITSFYVQ